MPLTARKLHLLRTFSVLNLIVLSGCRSEHTDRTTTGAPGPVQTGSLRSDVALPAPFDPTTLEDWKTLAPGVTTVLAQREDEQHRRIAWRVVRLDLSKVRMTAQLLGGRPFSALNLETGLLLAVNGGYFEADGSPSGLLAGRAETLGTYHERGGSGILRVEERHASISEATPTYQVSPNTDLTLQCGPRLVEQKGTVGIYRETSQRAARTAVCLRNHVDTLDLVLAWDMSHPTQGPELLHFAEWLAAPDALNERGCESAVNLDGGPSTGLVIPGHPELNHATRAALPYAITVKAR